MRSLTRFKGLSLSVEGRSFIFQEVWSRRLQFGGFVLLSLVAAVIEMTGVGLIFPLLIIIVDPASIDRVPVLTRAVDWLGIGRGMGLSILIVCLIGALMIGKNAYMLFFTWLQMRTLARWKTALSKRLMRTYLFSDYSVHLAKTSSEIIRNVSLTAAIFDHFVTALIGLIVNGVILVALCVMLFLVLPPETLLGLVLIAVASYGLYTALRRPFEEIGEELNALFKQRQSILRQSIGMIKETKLSAKEHFFLDAYVGVERRNFARQAHYNFLSTIPSLATEGAVILAILGIVTYILFFSGQQQTGLAVLGLLAATLFRLTPVINRILSSLQLMNLSRNSVDIVARELDELEEQVFNPEIEPEPLPFSNSIVFDRVGYSYPTSETRAVHDLNLEIGKNEMVGITGPSGSGKSTLAALLMGLVPPSEGTIRIDGVPLEGQARLRAWHKHIGFVPQSVFLIEDSIARNIAFASDPSQIDEQRIWEVLDIVQMRTFVESLPNGIHEFIGEDGSRLSGGQRQRVGIARVLYDDPEILVFDEATSALDAAIERAFSESLMRLRKTRTLVMIAHRLSTLRDCDRIIMLDKGTVLDVAPFDELQERCPAFRNLVELSRLERVA